MAWTLIAQAEALAGTTSAAVNTTGADLFVAATTYFSGSSSIVDNNGNTWTALTERVAGGVKTRIFYVVSPTTRSDHTFQNNAGGTFPVAHVYAFSGANTADAFDQESAGGTVTSGTSVQPGSMTPDENDCLVIQALGYFNSTGGTCSGYTVTNRDTNGSSYISGAGGYVIQTTAAATNPTWSWAGAADGAAAGAVFHGTGGGAVSPIIRSKAVRRTRMKQRGSDHTIMKL